MMKMSFKLSVLVMLFLFVRCSPPVRAQTIVSVTVSEWHENGQEHHGRYNIIMIPRDVSHYNIRIVDPQWEPHDWQGELIESTPGSMKVKFEEGILIVHFSAGHVSSIEWTGPDFTKLFVMRE